MICKGMFRDIVESLLSYTVKMRFKISIEPLVRQFNGSKVRRYLIMPRPLIYKRPYRLGEPQIIKCTWPEFPCQEAYLRVEPLRYLLQTLDPREQHLGTVRNFFQ